MVFPIEASAENISAAQEFLLARWNDRAAERGLSPRADLSGSCKFSSLFALTVFGAAMRGNADHQFNVLEEGSILDLNRHAADVADLEDPYRHDTAFWGNPEHMESMRSCAPRVAGWLADFRAELSGSGYAMKGPSESAIELYTQGSCHIFAAACVIAHGGHFLVASDYGKPHMESEDGESDIHEVIHVFAVLPDPEGGGAFIRDIHGDRNPGHDIREEVATAFGVWSGDVLLEEMTSTELLALVSDEDGVFAEALKISTMEGGMDHTERPLVEVYPGDVEEASGMTEVTQTPGLRLLVNTCDLPSP